MEKYYFKCEGCGCCRPCFLVVKGVMDADDMIKCPSGREEIDWQEIIKEEFDNENI